MTDPVQEAIAELVFADQLVDVHELEAIEADAWFRAYLSQRQLEPAAFTSRLMTAHEDPAVDEQALERLPVVDREALLNLLADLTAIDDHHDPASWRSSRALPQRFGFSTSRSSSGLQRPINALSL